MSIQDFIQLALNEHKTSEKTTTGINQNKVKSEALDIFNALYDEMIVLYLRSESDREYFLKSFSKFMGGVFPIKEEKKPPRRPNRKKAKLARLRFSKDGFFYWKTKEFKTLPQKEQDAWRKKQKKEFPWMPVSVEEEKLMKSNDPTHGIRFYTSKDFKKMSKKAQKEWGEQTGLPINQKTYEEFLSTDLRFQREYLTWRHITGKDVENSETESD